MWRSSLRQSGVLLFLVLGSLAEPASAQRAPIKLGKKSCVLAPVAGHQSQGMMCHVGNSLLLRADSTGVGELRLKPGPKLVVIGAAPCTMLRAQSGHAPMETCTVGNQEYVLDSTGVGTGELSYSRHDSTGVGELYFDKNNCIWVTVPGSGAKELECLYGTVVFHIDSTGVVERTAKTASRR
ncbi:MAG: hypothetical protein ACJ796_22035 [Gemmatimonadaceae bacterium]